MGPKTAAGTRQQRAAFTLVELLVVIVIVAVLAGMLFPVFARAREKARRASCASNLRQIGLSYLAYAADYDGLLPRADWCYEGGTKPLPGAPATAKGCGPFWGSRVNHYKWWYWTMPYVKSADLFWCPSRPYDETNDKDREEWTRNAEIENGYGLNVALTGALNVYGYASPPVHYGAIRNSFLGGGVDAMRSPAETFLLLDKRFICLPTNDYWTLVETTAWPVAYKQYWADVFFDGYHTNRSLIPARSWRGLRPSRAVIHDGGINLAFCDGHVKWMGVEAFLEKCPDKGEYLKKAQTPDRDGATADSGLLPGQTPWSHGGMTRDWPLWGLYVP